MICKFQAAMDCMHTNIFTGVEFEKINFLESKIHPFSWMTKLLKIVSSRMLCTEKNFFQVIPDIPYQSKSLSLEGHKLCESDLNLFLHPATSEKELYPNAEHISSSPTQTNTGQLQPSSQCFKLLGFFNFFQWMQEKEVRSKCTLDLYLPTTSFPKDGWPVVIFVHGGGWQRGDKHASRYFFSFQDVNLFVWLLQRLYFQCYGNVGASFVRAGVACAVVNYHLTSLRFPWFLVEVVSSSLFNYSVLFCGSLLISLVFVPWKFGRSAGDEFLEACSGDGPFLFLFEGQECKLQYKSSLLQAFEGLKLVAVLCFLWGGLRSELSILQQTPLWRLLPWAFILIFGLIQLLFLFILLFYYPTAAKLASKTHYHWCLKLAVSVANWFTMFITFTQLCFAFWREQHTAHLHPEHARDIAQAIRWAVQEGRDFNFNPNKLTLAGHSAGGHLASLITIDSTYLKEVGVQNHVIKAVISISGVYDLAKLAKSHWQRILYVEPVFGTDHSSWNRASPLFQVRILQKSNEDDAYRRKMLRQQGSGDINTKKLVSGVQLPPFLLMHAAKHEAGLDLQAAEFEQTLRTIGVDVTRYSIGGRNHFTMVSKIQDFLGKSQRDTVMEKCDTFLKRLQLLGDSYD